MTADLTSLVRQFSGSPWAGDESPAPQDGETLAPAPNPRWTDRIDDLLDIRRLTDDWDGLGAPAPAPRLVDSAIMLAGWMRGRGVLPPARIVPGLTGTVIFEWQPGPGDYVEVEVTKPFTAELTILRDGRPPEHRVL